MMKFLNKYYFILLVPFFILTNVHANTERVKSDLTHAMDVTLLMSQMVHSLQIERGNSSAYVSSNRLKFGVKLKKTKRFTSRLQKLLLHSLNTDYSTIEKYITLEERDTINLLFNDMIELRENVIHKKIDFPIVYSKYTQIIAVLLLTTSNISDRVENEKVGDALYAYATLLMYKESVGQKRASLSALFSQKQFSQKIYQYYLTSDTQEKIYLKSFLHNTSKDIKDIFTLSLNAPVVKKVLDYEKLALKKLKGEVIDVDVLKWFETSTLKINLIQDIEQTVLSNIMQKIDLAQNIHMISLTDKEKEWIKTHVVKIGVEQWSPVVFSNSGTDIDGIAGDFIKRIIQKTGLQIEVINDNWNTLLSDFKDQKLDLLPATYYTDKRDSFGLYSDAYFKMKDAIYVQKSNTDIHSLSDLNGKTLAIPAGYGTIDKLVKKFPNIKLVFTKDLDDSINRVLNGKVAALYEGQVAANYKIQGELINGLKSINVKSFKAPSLHFFSKINEPILQSIIQKALKSFSYQDKHAIIAKWINQNKSVNLTASEQEWIDKEKVIKYAFDPLWKPFEWQDEMGEHEGITSDIIKLIKDKSGLKLEALSSQSWIKALDKIKSNEAQIFSALGETKERKEYLNFTDKAFLSIPYVFLAKKGNSYIDGFESIEDKTLEVVKGFTIESLLKEKMPQLVFKTSNTLLNALDKLNDGESDVVILNGITARYYLNLREYEDLYIAYKTDLALELKMGIRKDTPDVVLDILNKTIATFNEKEIGDIVDKWSVLAVRSDTNWTLILKILAVMFLILLIGVYWNRKLTSMVEEKTSSLEEQKDELTSIMSTFDKNVIFSRTDLKGIIVHVSDAFCEISGYTREELLGKSHSIVRHPDMESSKFKELWTSLIQRACIELEIKNLKKDGGFYWTSSKFEPDFDKSGKCIGYSAIREDITAKKAVDDLTVNLEAKVKEQTKEAYEQKAFVQTLLDSQEQLIITTNGEKLITANETFFDFFAVDDVDEFMNVYDAKCICDTFKLDGPEGYLQIRMGEDGRESWIDYVISRSFGETHKAMISMGSRDFIFSVTGAKLPGNKGIKSAVFTNITDMENAKQEVEQILANILLPVLITSKKSRTITYANKYAEKQYEISIDDIIGSDIDSVYTVKDQHHHIVDTIMSDGFIENSEEDFITATGKCFTALLSVIPIMYKGEDSYIGMVADITEQKNREKEIDAIHKHTKESIEYASLIQSALIPDKKLFKNYFQDYFTIWNPKDLVGGDIYLFEELRNDNECLLMVIDCTGHGVPGAFVTMLVKAIERQITSKINNSDEIVSPAKILGIFNQNMKELLKQESRDSISNAGFDGGIIYYNKKDKVLKFAGAETPLFYVEDDTLKVIKGDRYSVGYKKCVMDYEYKEHTIELKEGMRFYLTTDGYIDQNGGEKGFPLGKKKFQAIIKEHYKDKMLDQETVFMDKLNEYQDKEERNDDITLVGFKV